MSRVKRGWVRTETANPPTMALDTPRRPSSVPTRTRVSARVVTVRQHPQRTRTVALLCTGPIADPFVEQSVDLLRSRIRTRPAEILAHQGDSRVRHVECRPEPLDPPVGHHATIPPPCRGRGRRGLVGARAPGAVASLAVVSKRSRRKKPDSMRRRRTGRPSAPRPATQEEPDLLRQVAEAMSEDHPLGLLMFASSLLASLDPPPRSPFDPEPAPGAPTREELVTTFLDVDRPETTALCAVVAELVDDEMLERRIRRELAQRPHALPRWLSELSGAAAAEPVVEMVHALGDGDTTAFGVRLPGGGEIAVMVYVDHNLGTVVKDLGVGAEPVSALVERMRTSFDDPDISVRPLAPADARERLKDAIRTR